MKSSLEPAMTSPRSSAPEGLPKDALSAVRALKAQAEAGKWQRITPGQNLPTTDCEIIRPIGGTYTYAEVRRVSANDLEYPDDWIGFTHYRRSTLLRCNMCNMFSEVVVGCRRVIAPHRSE